MTKEDKELLLKDLCARLPYGVKCCVKNNNKVCGDLVGTIGENIFLFSSGHGTFNINIVKPYLFPLSSMTEEQKSILSLCNAFIEPRSIELKLNFYNEQHIDWRGLISIGLALDATDKNIY